MDLLTYGVIALVLLVTLALIRRPGRRPKHDYEQTNALFTAAERSFLGVLDLAVVGRYRVFGKVRVADVLKTRKGMNNSARASAFNKVNAKHFDFVLCDPKTLSIKAVVELNDKSHAKGERAERDHFLREACAGAGLKLIEIPAQRSYSSEGLRQLLDSLEIRPQAATIGASGLRIEPHF
jgi:hypothetical protein